MITHKSKSQILKMNPVNYSQTGLFDFFHNYCFLWSIFRDITLIDRYEMTLIIFICVTMLYTLYGIPLQVQIPSYQHSVIFRLSDFYSIVRLNIIV